MLKTIATHEINSTAHTTQCQKKNHRHKETEHREASHIEAQGNREKTRQQTRERVRKYCEKKRTKAQEYNSSMNSPGLANCMSKKHATNKVKKTLPSTPRKKVEIVQSINKSPRTRKVLCERGVLKTPEGEKETKTWALTSKSKQYMVSQEKLQEQVTFAASKFHLISKTTRKKKMVCLQSNQ